MNASQIINDSMTLEEKLAAIDKAMENAQVEHKRMNPNAAPLDPAENEMFVCQGCQ